MGFDDYKSNSLLSIKLQKPCSSSQDNVCNKSCLHPLMTTILGIFPSIIFYIHTPFLSRLVAFVYLFLLFSHFFQIFTWLFPCHSGCSLNVTLSDSAFLTIYHKGAQSYFLPFTLFYILFSTYCILFLNFCFAFCPYLGNQTITYRKNEDYVYLIPFVYLLWLKQCLVHCILSINIFECTNG